MTWAELQERIRREFRVTRDEPTWMGISWCFEENGVEIAQNVQIALRDSWLCIVAGVNDRDRVDPRAALEHNGTLLVGALCWIGPLCVLRHITPLAGLDGAALERAIDLVAHEATRLRRFLVLTPAERSPALDYFAE